MIKEVETSFYLFKKLQHYAEHAEATFSMNTAVDKQLMFWIYIPKCICHEHIPPMYSTPDVPRNAHGASKSKGWQKDRQSDPYVPDFASLSPQKHYCPPIILKCLDFIFAKYENPT